MRLAGVDPAKVARVADQSMASNVAALRRGEVDVIQIFQPFARMLVEEGVGHLWYAAASRGLACYTTLNTTRAFIENHSDTVLRMTRAVYRAEKWIRDHDGEQLASVVGRISWPVAGRAGDMLQRVQVQRGMEHEPDRSARRPGVEARGDALLRRDTKGVVVRRTTSIRASHSERWPKTLHRCDSAASRDAHAVRSTPRVSGVRRGRGSICQQLREWLMAQSSVVHSDPDILGGNPVFVGTRVPVQALIDYFEGETFS